MFWGIKVVLRYSKSQKNKTISKRLQVYIWSTLLKIAWVLLGYIVVFFRF